jgi:hypothetical protein
MNATLVEKVVNAVLYEGYILYPYRASSKKIVSALRLGAFIRRLTASRNMGRAVLDAD